MNHRRTRARLLAVAGGVVLTVGLIPASGLALATVAPGSAPAANAQREQVENYDARTDSSASKVLATRAAKMNANPRAGVKALRNELGMKGIVELDALTGTPRRVTRIDGFLTTPSTRSADQVARGYLKAHADAFGLSSAQINSLVLRKTYVDIGGTSHLSYVQRVGGVTVFGNGLRAHVTKKGQLVQVDGSPLAALPSSLGGPGFSADAARDKAVKDVFGSSKATVISRSTGADRFTEFSGHDHAKLVVFQTLAGPRLGWQTLTMREGFVHVIDAQSGRTLFRQSIVAKDNGNAWTNYPGAAVGGTQQSVDLTAPGWLRNHSRTLSGNNAHVWIDINDNDQADKGEEIGPSGPSSFAYGFTPFGGDNCANKFVCSWDPNVAFSWQANAKQDAVQMFFFLGTFHDHLLAAPIGFTPAAGNFEGRDAVDGNAIDGALGNGNGLPDGGHVDNANMSTPPDGIPPRMQMYLFHQPGTSYPDEDPFIAGNSGDEADIVYHEYTHGLSNRLVVDANGISTLGGVQAGSMGEAWSDWYAMDYLVNTGQFVDREQDGDLRVGEYVGAGNNLIRTEPMDCSVGANQARCPGTPGAGSGGYTYGDFGRVGNGPEVHDDGEIWGQTLWDLRNALGSAKTESLVTRAMELSPANPSFLDERNSILAADMVVNNGGNQDAIWQVFAHRGMGWFAGSVDGDDSTPTEDFSMPPAPNAPKGSITGTVSDSATGAPIAGAVVAFGGHNSGFAGSYATTSAANGTYTITGIFTGTYPRVFSRGGVGYDALVKTVVVSSGTTTVDWPLRRDWAASSGGATVTEFSPPDYTPFGCGPLQLIDQSQGSGWGSDAPNPPAGFVPGPKHIIIKLPVKVNIDDLQINPANTCGDPGSASTGDYLVETSQDGIVYTTANSGNHFGIADRHLHTITMAPGSTAGVQYIRFTMLGTQVIDLGGDCAITPDAFAGCTFMDSTELAVYGAPA